MDPILILLTILALLALYLGVGIWVGLGLYAVAITSLALFRTGAPLLPPMLIDCGSVATARARSRLASTSSPTARRSCITGTAT